MRSAIAPAAALACSLCAAQVGLTPAPSQRRAIAYQARIAGENGLPLAVTPQIFVHLNREGAYCGSIDVFRNGTVVFELAGLDLTQHAAKTPPCYITIVAAGYRTAHAALTDGAVIVVKRLGENEGSTISIAVLKAPEKAKSAYQRGSAALGAGKWDLARRELSRAVEIYPEYATAWSDLGDALKGAGDTEGALKAYERASQADPKYMKPYVQLARLRLDRREWEEAAGAAQRAIDLNAIEFPGAFYYHAIAAFNLGRFEAAEANARRALEVDTDHAFPNAEYVYGSVLAKRGDRAGAIAHMKEYLKLAPRANDAASVKARIAELEREGP